MKDSAGRERPRATWTRFVATVWFLVVAIGAGVLGAIIIRGVSARDEPTFAETVIARAARRLAIPAAVRAVANPLPATDESIRSARAHFADHCAMCHGNDGKGQTSLGVNMYPKVPDMTLPATQSMSDGEIFAIIENGVRLTGMPAFGTPSADDDRETWELVHFIRRLPRLTSVELDEMKGLNPKTRREFEEEEEIRRFLSEADEPRKPGGR